MASYTVYPASRHEDVCIARGADGKDFLLVGEERRPLDHAAAQYLARAFPVDSPRARAAPRPHLRRRRPAGHRLSGPPARV